jgi:hypothetical protein
VGLEAALPWVIGATVLAVYGRLTAPLPYLLDSSELAAAAFGLGLPHPPGEPVAVLWGKLFTLLPLGSVAFRVGLGQAVAGAAAAVLVHGLVRRGLQAVAGDALPRAAAALLAAAAALGYALAPGALVVSHRPEVYALQTALSLGALRLALGAADRRDGRLALLGGLCIGLGVANHPLVAGLAGLGAVAAALTLFAGPDHPPPARLVGGACAAFAAGAAAVAYLPARAFALYAQGAAAIDTLAWGDPRSLSGLRWVLTAETFARKASVVHAEAEPLALPFAFFEELGIAGALLALVGLWAGLRRPGGRVWAVALGLTCAGAAAAALAGGFEPGNPDKRGYLGPALATGSVLAALGAGALLAALPRARWQTIAAGAHLALALAHVLPVGPAASLRGARAADLIAGALLDEVPPRGALLTSYFQTAFLLAYQRGVEGRRPDVAHAHLGFVRGPGYAERLAAAEPDLAPALAAHRRELDPETLTALDARRPVRLEVDQHLGPALRARLHPAGLTWTIRTDATGAADAVDLPPTVFGEAQSDREVRGYLAYRAYVDAELACARGLRATAARRLDELARLVPEDLRARALAARCPTGARP